MFTALTASRWWWRWSRSAGRAPFLRVAGGPLSGGGLLLLSCISIQVGAAVATTTFKSVSPTGAAGLRFSFAAVLLVAIARPRPRAWDRARWRLTLLFAAAAAGNEVFLYLALDRLPLGMAVTIEFLGPLALAVGAARRWTQLATVALALGGVALLSNATLSSDPIGIALAAAAAVGWALYILASNRVGGLSRPLDSLALGMCAAAALTSPLAIAQASHLDERPPVCCWS